MRREKRKDEEGNKRGEFLNKIMLFHFIRKFKFWSCIKYAVVFSEATQLYNLILNIESYLNIITLVSARGFAIRIDHSAIFLVKLFLLPRSSSLLLRIS